MMARRVGVGVDHALPRPGQPQAKRREPDLCGHLGNIALELGADVERPVG